MRLYYAPTSPYVRKVMIVLQQTAQLDQVELLAVSGTPVAPGSMPLGQNPLGKIPTLVTSSGEALFDSRVITRYLDARGEGGLYPAGDALWPALTLEALGDGIADAALLMAYETRVRPEAMYCADWVEGQWAKAHRAMAELEQSWIPRLEEGFGIGQIAVIAALGYVDLRHGGRNWRADFPKLGAWADALASRPSVLATKAD